MAEITKETILSYVQTLMARVRIANSYLSIYKSLCDRGNEYYDELNAAPLFFTMVKRSLVHSLMLEMCKLFEDGRQRGKVMSIQKIYNICEQNQSVFSNREQVRYNLGVTKERLEMLASIIENLKNQRDTIWAHSDKKYILNPVEIEQQYKIDWSELEKLLDFASDFLNSLLNDLTEGTVEAPFFNGPTACDDDVLHIMDLIRLGRETGRKNDEEKLSRGETEKD